MRGATLELLDITYDGEEDSVTGVLSGGLGQLVSGGSSCSSSSTVSAILTMDVLVAFIITITIIVIATNHHQ